MNKALKSSLAKLSGRLQEISSELADARWVEEEVETLQEAFDSKSEKWQESDKGEAAQELLNQLEAVVSSLAELAELASTASDDLNDIVGEA